MPKWNFPADTIFDIADKGGFFINCHIIEQDEETITFDYDGPANMRLRCQMKMEDITAVRYAMPFGSSP